MVGNHPHGNVGLRLIAVTAATQPAYLRDDVLEDIGIIIRLLALDDHAKPLKTHPRVDMAGRKGLQLAVGLPVILDKHQVPYLDDLRMVAVHQLVPRNQPALGLITDIHMNL